MPGPLLAALAWLTLKEPRRALPTAGAVVGTLFPGPSKQGAPSLREVCATLYGNVTFRHLLLCLAVFFFFSYGMLQWQPAFFMRSFGLSSGLVGSWLAVSYGLATLVGTYLGGELATRYAPHDEPLQLKGMAWALGVSGLLSVFVYLSSNAFVAFIWLGLATIAQNTLNGPLFSTIQTLVLGMRGGPAKRCPRTSQHYPSNGTRPVALLLSSRRNII